MSHLKAKVKKPVLERTRQSEDKDLYYVLVGFVYQLFLFLKDKIKSLSGKCWKNFNMKTIEMSPPVPLFNLFKKSSMVLYLILKVKSQAKAYIVKTVVCCLLRRKDVKKTVKKKIGKRFLELTCLIFYLSFKPVLFTHPACNVIVTSHFGFI